MILLPEWTTLQPSSPSRHLGHRGVDPTPVDALPAVPDGLLPNEALALRDILKPREDLLGGVRGAVDDEVYLWVATPRRVLHLLHGRCVVALYREVHRRDVRALQLRRDGERVSMALSSRRRTYHLHRAPLPNALAFARAVGLDAVLTTPSVDLGGAGT